MQDAVRSETSEWCQDVLRLYEGVHDHNGEERLQTEILCRWLCIAGFRSSSGIAPSVTKNLMTANSTDYAHQLIFPLIFPEREQANHRRLRAYVCRRGQIALSSVSCVIQHETMQWKPVLAFTFASWQLLYDWGYSFINVCRASGCVQRSACQDWSACNKSHTSKKFLLVIVNVL